MTVDMHAHLIAPSRRMGKARLNVWNRLFRRLLDVDSPESFEEKIVRDLSAGPVDRAVVCAIEGSPLAANNRETAEFCRRHPGFLYGANLNPLSPTPEADIDAAAGDGAVLVKFLPSFQRVDPADPRCLPFWRALAARGLPLLVHTGPEHSLSGGPSRYNDPSRLEAAAAAGVVVICAHCGCPMMWYERGRLGQWADLVRRHPNVYGDASGCCGAVRRRCLARILRDPLLASRLVFGTDYPSFTRIFGRGGGDGNLFSEWHAFFRNAGCDESFFSRGAGLLGLEAAS